MRRIVPLGEKNPYSSEKISIPLRKSITTQIPIFLARAKICAEEIYFIVLARAVYS
jgi:hypothetical protein